MPPATPAQRETFPFSFPRALPVSVAGGFGEHPRRVPRCPTTLQFPCQASLSRFRGKLPCLPTLGQPPPRPSPRSATRFLRSLTPWGGPLMMGRVFEFASDGGRIVARKTKKSGLTAVAIILGRLAARAEARAGQARQTAEKE